MVVNLRFPLNRAIELFQNNVTLTTITNAYNQYGDVNNSSSTSTTVIAAVNDITGAEDWNNEGVFIPGDKIFFFKGVQTGVNVGSTITLNEVDYAIDQEPIKHIIGNLIQAIEVRAKRV